MVEVRWTISLLCGHWRSWPSSLPSEADFMLPDATAPTRLESPISFALLSLLSFYILFSDLHHSAIQVAALLTDHTIASKSIRSASASSDVQVTS